MHSRFRTSEMEGPYLSILILTHNRPEFLRQAIDSVNKGHIENIEVVVLNTGHPVPMEKYWKIRYYHEPELGLTESYKRLIDLAEGQYSIFLEDDDKLVINPVWEKIMMYDHDLYLFNYFLSNEVGHKFEVKTLWEDAEFSSRDFLKKMHNYDTEGQFHLGQLMFKSELAKKIEFPKSDVIGMDEYFLYKLLTISENVLTCSQPGYMARVHGDNLSWNNPRKVLENAKTPIHLIYKDVQTFLGASQAKEWGDRLGKIYDAKLTSAREKLLTPRKITSTRK